MANLSKRQREALRHEEYVKEKHELLLDELPVADRMISETKRVAERFALIQELYGKGGIPIWAKFVMRCGRCHSFMIFCDEVPFSPTGLSPLKCKKCGALQAMVNNRQNYHPDLLVGVEKDVENHMGKAKATQKA